MKKFFDFGEIKRLVTITMVMSHFGITPRTRYLDKCRGACPLHVSSSPRSRSFSWTRDEWYCHRCKLGGDVIRLWAKIMNKTDYEAALELQSLFIDQGRCRYN